MTDLIKTPFKDIRTSTMTFLIKTNVNINLEKLFEKLPIKDVHINKKKPKKNELFIPNGKVDDGDIVSMIYNGQVKGHDFRIIRKKKRNMPQKYFRNCMNIVMNINSKNIFIKIYKNGSFQLTGVNNIDIPMKFFNKFWSFLSTEKEIYNINDTNLVVNGMIVPVLTNMDFDLGIIVDREKLSKYISMQNEFSSLLEATQGYTGVNIKIPMKVPFNEIVVDHFEYKEDTKSFLMTKIKYDEYINSMKPRDILQKLRKVRYNTFLVFHSGKVIISGMCPQTMSPVYDYFLTIMNRCYEDVREVLTTGVTGVTATVEINDIVV